MTSNQPKEISCFCRLDIYAKKRFINYFISQGASENVAGVAKKAYYCASSCTIRFHQNGICSLLFVTLLRNQMVGGHFKWKEPWYGLQIFRMGETTFYINVVRWMISFNSFISKIRVTSEESLWLVLSVVRYTAQKRNKHKISLSQMFLILTQILSGMMLKPYRINSRDIKLEPLQSTCR